MRKRRKTQLHIDALLKDYLANNARFADMLNAIIFGGKQFVNQAMISDYDSDVSTVYNGISQNRNRDVIKHICIDGFEGLIAIENQAQVSSDMPYRVREYDCHNYLKQYHQMRANHQRYPLLQIMTLVIYYGEHKWYGPKTYAEVAKIPPPSLQTFMDYHMFPIVEINKLDAQRFHNQDNFQLINGLQKLYQWKGDIEALKGMRVSKDVAMILAGFMDDYKFLNLIKEESEEIINMCESFQLFKAKSIAEGKSSTLIKLLIRKFGSLSSDIIVEIETGTPEQLEQLTLHIFDIQDEDDVRKILT